MRPLTHLVAPWLLAVGIAGFASPSAAQVVVGGHIGISVGSPGAIAQPYPPPRRGYPEPGHLGPYPGAPGWTARHATPWAYEAGFDDGYREGWKDGRRGRWYDPVGQREFRRASRGYHREYGPRSFYQQHYRHGFREGYERGYREAYYSHRGHGPKDHGRPW